MSFYQDELRRKWADKRPYTKNPVEVEKYIIEYRNGVKRLMHSFGEYVKDERVNEYAGYCLELKMTLNEVTQAISYLLDTCKRFPVPAEFKDILRHFSKLRSESSIRERDSIQKQIESDLRAYESVKEELLKVFSQEQLTNWTRMYCMRVFGDAWKDHEYLGIMERIAIKDFARFSHIKDPQKRIGRVVEYGKEQIGK